MSKIILQAIKDNAQKTPEKLAIIDPSTKLTYKDFWQKIQSSCEHLKDLGVQKNDCILIKNTQNVDYLVLCHAIQLSGAICVPMEKSVNEGRVLEIKEDANAKFLISDEQIGELNFLEMSVILSSTTVTKTHDLPSENDTAMILFTTGTTGKSKGIVISYKAEYAVAENIKHGVKMSEDNIEIIPMPMNHSYSLRRYFANMLNASTVILIDGVFFVKIFFQMLEKYKATAVALAPAAMSIIFKLTRDKIADYKDQLDYIQFGAAPLPEADKQHLLEIFPDLRLYNIYGSTEMGCACILNFNSEDNNPNCIGYPAINSTFKVVDKSSNTLENATEQDPGFLSYTGSMSMTEYLGEPLLTNQTLIDGYLQSSDLGYIDEKGRVYMLGRADDIIISGGNKISPLEVEESAKKFGGIVDCICKGKPDNLLGAVPILYVQTEEGFDTSKLDSHLANLLEDFKRPRQILIAKVIPRTYNGKLDRKVLVEV